MFVIRNCAKQILALSCLLLASRSQAFLSISTSPSLTTPQCLLDPQTHQQQQVSTVQQKGTASHRDHSGLRAYTKHKNYSPTGSRSNSNTQLFALLDIVGTSPEPIHTAFSIATFVPQPFWLLIILLPKWDVTKKLMGGLGTSVTNFLGCRVTVVAGMESLY